MEAIITKKETPLKVLFYGWMCLQHSYGICLAFLLINLYKNYGPDGKIKKNAIDIYVQEAPFFNPEWNNKKKWVYSDEYNNILKNLKIYNGEKIDIIYKQTYPYDINVTNENKDIPKCIFYTSEFAKLTQQYFTLDKPVDLDVTKSLSKLPENCEALLAEREIARLNKDWSRSDALRDELAELGILVSDTSQGQEWEYL